MIKKILHFLLKRFGKSYQIAEDLPDKLIIRILFVRFMMIARGLFKLRRLWVFVGRSTSIKNKGNIQFGKGVTIDHHCDIDGYAKEKVMFGNSSKIGAYSILSVTSHMSKLGKGFSLGANSGIGEYAFIGAAGGVEIGDNVIMGQYISFHSENHNFQDPHKLIREQGVTSKGIKLGNDIWVGSKVTFLDGCEVGDHCVVAAGAVVKDKFPPNCIIGGIPAKILKNIADAKEVSIEEIK